MNAAHALALIASTLLIAAPIALAEPEPENENENPTTETPAPLKYCVDIITSTVPPTVLIYEC